MREVYISSVNHAPISVDVPASVTWIHRLGRLFFSFFSYIVFKVYVRLRIEGKEQLPARPFIICSNHQSHLDSIILASIARTNFNYTALIAAKDYWFDNKLRYRLASCFLNLIPISRKENSSFTITTTKKIVRQFINDTQGCIVMLPEGTRSTNSEIQPFKKGISLLAASLALPIVPVYIDGTGRLWPKGSFFPKPGRVTIMIGPAVFPAEINSVDNTEMVRNRIITLKNNGK